MNTYLLMIIGFQLVVIAFVAMKLKKSIRLHNMCKDAYITTYHTYRKIVGEIPQLISNPDYIAEDFKNTLEAIVNNERAPGYKAFKEFVPKEYLVSQNDCFCGITYGFEKVKES